MKWLLILIVMNTAGTEQTVTVAEFSSEHRCVAAGKGVQEKLKAVLGTAFLCVEK